MAALSLRWRSTERHQFDTDVNAWLSFSLYELQQTVFLLANLLRHCMYFMWAESLIFRSLFILLHSENLKKKSSFLFELKSKMCFLLASLNILLNACYK